MEPSLPFRRSRHECRTMQSQSDKVRTPESSTNREKARINEKHGLGPA